MLRSSKFYAVLIAVILVLSLVPALGETSEAGAFRVDTFQGGAMGVTFTELTVDGDAPVTSLWTNQDVKNILVETLAFNENGEVSTAVLFAQESIASNQVLNIAMNAQGAYPFLRVSGENEKGERETWYVAMADGRPVLLKAEQVDAARFDFSVLNGLPFTFCSGVGGWETVMTVSPDGRFEGEFHDSDMGDTGSGYPNGTVYISLFEGRLESVRQANAWTWELRITEMNDVTGMEGEEIRDGVRYIPSAPYGLENAETLLLYLPSAPLQDLSGDFLSWAHLFDADRDRSAALNAWGLFNEAEGYGFVTPGDD